MLVPAEPCNRGTVKTKENVNSSFMGDAGETIIGLDRWPGVTTSLRKVAMKNQVS